MATAASGIASDVVYTQEPDCCEVFEYYETPSRDHPSGRKITIIYDKENPPEEKPAYYKEERLNGFIPFIFIRDNANPSHIWGRSIITDLREPQTLFNKVRSIEYDWAKRGFIHLIPKNLISGIAEPDYDEVTNVIFTNPSAESTHGPMTLRGPDMPAALAQFVQSIPSELEHLSGLHEIVLRSQTPYANMPDILVARLEEKDKIRMGATANSIAIGLGQLGKSCLLFVKEYFPATFIINILGHAGKYQYLEFRKANIRDGFDVVVDPQSILPKSRERQKADILNLYQAGIIPQTDENRRRLLRLGWPDLADKVDEGIIHEDIALKENERMLKGEKVDINGSEETGFIDRHDIHYRIHLEEELRCIRRGDFRSAALITAHRSRHQNILEAIQMELMKKGEK